MHMTHKKKTQKVNIKISQSHSTLATCFVVPTSSGMSESDAHGTPNPNALHKRPKSGMRAALEYTGIPPSWFDKRPKLPSRNWLIFISVTSSVVGYYVYDRRQCNQIRQSYVDRVKHLAEEPLNSLDPPRKVTVYGTKWPGDEDHDRSMKYFRKYVKVCLFCVGV
jgi:import inner membrane translocase subunit TIM54